MTGFSLRASPIELSIKVFGFRSTFCTQAGRKKKIRIMEKNCFFIDEIRGLCEEQRDEAISFF
jgi:hypothetical protein